MESSDQFICFFCGSLSDEYGCPCSTCELCGNDAHYGYDCPSQVPFVYNQDPCFNQNLDNFPQTSPSFPQQYLCCEDCGGPHATFECQPMNQNFYEPNFCYNSNSSGFDQFQPPQYPVIHQPRQEMSTEMLLAKEKLIKAIRTCLKNNNQPPEEKSIAVFKAEESKPNNLPTLGNTLNQLKQEEQDSSQYWKPPIYYFEDDDDLYRESIDETPPSDAITPGLPITDSLVMEDEHHDTILEMNSDEEIESSVENLNLTPSDSEDLSDYKKEVGDEDEWRVLLPIYRRMEVRRLSKLQETRVEVLEALDDVAAEMSHQGGHVASIWTKGKLKQVAENENFINKIDENMKKIIKEQVKVQVKEQISKILPRIEKSVNEQLEAEVLIRSSNEAKTSHAKTLYKALVDAYESNKFILATYGDTVTLKRYRDDEDEDEEPFAGSNWGSKRRRAGKEPKLTSAPKDKTSKSTRKSKKGSKSHQKSIDKSAQAEEPIHTDEDLEEPAHQEFNIGYTENQLVDETTQFPDWFQKPAKPPTPARDWNKNLPAAHGPIQSWISNLSQKEDPRESFNELMDTPLDFSAFVLNRLKVDTLTPELLAGPTFELMKCLCKSLVELEYFLEEGRKRQQFYGFVVNRESARDVYSRNRILAVTKLKIVEWHNYKHLDWITVRRNDDKLYTFKEGDYNRLRLQDIEDMLLLLVQGKLTNLNVEERLALGVSLRMFTRSIVLRRRVEDLQLGVESYQKKLNLTRPDTYRSDLKRKSAYTAYSNPRGFIYQNKDKKNRLMRIDELYKFSDGTLNDVRSALDDILKRIRMEYLPQTVWRNVDRERAGAMIQAIDRQLRNRRLMRSLEKFVGGRLYGGDLRLLERTI
ncbi:hypothetical protein Tco_0574252 [Tanacetum coccineum]